MAHLPEERTALGAQLAKVRKEAGYTLDAVAIEMKERGHSIGKAAVGAWETGRNVPDALWLRRLAALYGTTLDGLAWPEKIVWPLSAELHHTVVQLNKEELGHLESVMRAHLGLSHVTEKNDTKRISQVPLGPSIGGTNRAPGQNNSVVLPDQVTGDQIAGRQSGSLQKQRGGRNPKRFA